MSARIMFLLVFFCLTLLLSIASAKLFATTLRLSPAASKVVLIISAVLPFLLIGVMTLATLSHELFARIAYTAITALAGCAVYFLCAAGILGGIYLLNLVFPFEWNTVLTAQILALAAFAAGAVGLVQGLTIRSVSYDITAPALSAWKGKTAVLVSDTHFGLVNQTRLAERTARKIQEINPDMVFIAGDYFDGPAFNLENIRAPWTALAAQYPVFHAPGNHEGYGNYGLFMDTIRSFGIQTLEDQSVQFEGIHIAGFMYRPKSEEAAIETVIHQFGIPSFEGMVAINHPPMFYDTFNKTGFDLVVSGHSHRGQFWPINYIVRAIYGKYYYGHHQIDDMHVVTTSGVGTAGPPLRLFNPPEVVELHFK